MVLIFDNQPQFSEIGAGVGMGEWYFGTGQHANGHCSYFPSGPNAVRALRGLGVLDDILARVEEPLGKRALLFISGLPGHEEVYDVRT
jgi:salicylate hydroxylase